MIKIIFDKNSLQDLEVIYNYIYSKGYIVIDGFSRGNRSATPETGYTFESAQIIKESPLNQIKTKSIPTKKHKFKYKRK